MENRETKQEQPTVSLDYEQASGEREKESIRIQIERKASFEKYSGSYTYDNLPIEFRVLFESLRQFFDFLGEERERIRLQEGRLYIPVSIVGKSKEFLLSLDKQQLSPEEELKKQIWQLQGQVAAQKTLLETLRESLAVREGQLQEKEKIIDTMGGVLKEKDNENMRLAGRIRLVEAQLEELMCEEKGGKEENQLQESRMTEEFTPIKKASSKSKKLRQLQQFGRRLLFRLDEGAKHFNKFRALNNEVQKLHGPTYQLFHNEALPREGKYFFDVRIILIKNNNIVVGVITDKNKDEQFSFKKMNCVCYNGYDGSICEQERQKYVNVKPKEGNKIRTVVDMTAGTIEWHIMGGELQRNLIGRACIPLSMAKQPLYPYFELYWESNKVRLNS